MISLGACACAPTEAPGASWWAGGSECVHVSGARLELDDGRAQGAVDFVVADERELEGTLRQAQALVRLGDRRGALSDILTCDLLLATCHL